MSLDDFEEILEDRQEDDELKMSRKQALSLKREFKRFRLDKEQKQILEQEEMEQIARQLAAQAQEDKKVQDELDKQIFAQHLAQLDEEKLNSVSHMLS